MFGRVSILALMLLCLQAVAGAVTLEKLSLEEMIASSTMVVRATVGDATSMARGVVLYTDYELHVAEDLGGSDGSKALRVALPGGQIGGRRQVFPGVPVLSKGAEYVFFLWRGSDGSLQLVGLTQGLLEVRGKSKAATASRAPIEGMLLSRKSGLPVRDEGMRVPLEQLRAAVRASARASGGQR